MRQMLRFIAWLVAALFCVVATVVFSYGVTILASIAFRFSFVDDPAAVTWLYGSMAVFAIISLAFLMFLIIKMTKGER